MRKIHLLRKSERKSVGTTLALTVGSPSFDRRHSALKHLAFMLLFLLGSLNVWGEDPVSGSILLGNASGEWNATTTASFTDENDLEWSRTYSSNNKQSIQSGMCQFGNSSNPCTSLVLSTTIGSQVTLSAFSANFTGGASKTSGTIKLYSGTTELASETVSGTASVTCKISSSVLVDASDALKVEYTGTNGSIKISGISYTYTPEGDPSEPTPSLDHIAITGAPEKDTYEAGESFDPTGLTVTGTYSDGSQAPITSGITWAYDPSQTLSLNQTSIGVTATVDEISSPKYNVTGLSVTAALPKSSLIFTAACKGSGTANDGVKWTVESDAAESSFDTDRGVHYGTSQKAVSYIELTSDVFSDKIKKIEVEAAGSNTPSITVTVGDATFGETATGITTRNVKYTFEPTPAQSGTEFTGVIVVRLAKGSSANGALYVKSVVVTYESDGKDPADLAYEEADKSNLVKVGANFTAPTLTNPNTLPVAYESSNTDVVEVNASTGAITAIKAAGKAEITASFTGDENYQAGSAKYTIYVAEQAGTAEDPLTEASAKALIDLGCTLRAHVKGTVATVGDLNTNYGSISLTLTNGFQFYGMLNIGGSKFTENPFGAGDVVTAVGNLKKHNTTYELDLNCQLVERIPFAGSKTSIANTKETAYTVAQALAYAADPTTYDLTDHVYIAGVVYQVNSFNSTNGTYNIYIKDAGTSEDDGKFEFYKCSGLYEVGGTPAQFEEGDVQIGDEVIGYGVMTYFSGGSIWEFGQPNQLVALNRPKVPVTGVGLDQNTASIEVGKTVTLHATITPDNASNKAITWTVESGDTYASVDGGVVTGKAAGEAVIRATSNADNTKYAECTVTVTEPAPLSPWATVYSSNVTVGAEDYTIKILKPGSTTEYDEFEGMRYGTSNAPGVATITIPASTQALHFHAAAWNTETVTLEVKVGAETYPLTFGELVKEANIKGNGTTYELSTPIDEYYMLDLSSYTIADNTVITFTATGGKRFVLYGVNQEGGLVPELDRIEISGTATELEYEVGDVFNPAGLGANAIYTLGGDEQEPVAIDAKDIEWSFEPATIAANTTSVTVTATYEGKNDQTNVPITVTVPEPEIIVSAASLAFNNVAKEAAVADKELTVTLKSVENATLTITGDGASAFSVNPAALTASGTVAVSASSDNVGTFNATLTISDDAGAAEAKTVALSITVEASDDLSGTWNLVTDAAELMPGMQVIIASVADENVVKTMGQQNSNNRAAVASTVAGTVLTPAAGTKVFTLVDAGNGKFAFQAVNGSYLYASSSTKNYLVEKATNDANGQWTISIADGKATITAQGSYSRKLMRFNPNNGNPLFACYAENSTTGTLVTLYAKPFDYTRNVSGNYATICLPKAGKIIGATLYEIAYYGVASKKIFFDEIVNGEMEAGIPYIFQPAAGVEKINVYYSDNTVADVEARNRNGLIGFYDLNNPAARHDIDQDAGFYILYNNQYWLVSGRKAYVENYRAYIKLADITPSEPTLAPGRRRISMSVNDTQATTGFENAEANEAPHKVLINGELFILRGEKVYDAKGQLVK